MKSDTPSIPRKMTVYMGQGSSAKTGNYEKYKDCFVTINDFYFSRPIPISLYPNGVFTEKLEKFILEGHQHGFLIPKQDEPEEKSSDEPKVLTMKMLEAGFVLWLVSICLACIVFICEHIVRYNSNRRIIAREILYTNTFYAQLMDERIST